MKQKLFFLMLTLIMLSAASVQAQVTIGADEPPHSAAVLDLQSDNLGLKLPTIELGDVSVFQLSGTATNADGIMIYNSSEETIGGSGKGIYVWEGKWIFAGKSAPVTVPVTKITITSTDDVKQIGSDGTLQLTATVEPANASNKTLNWIIVYDPSLTAGNATIDQNGLITAVKPGNVTARATATDGSGVYRNFTFSVLPSGYAEGITVISENGNTHVNIGSSLQLGIVTEPTTAFQGVTWSVGEGSSIASISGTGLLTATGVGTVTAIATASIGTPVSGNISIEILPLDLATTTPILMDGIEYQSYKFGSTTWMVENSQAGTYTYNLYDFDPEKPSMYYTQPNAAGACLDGWSLPKYEDAQSLMFYLQTLASDQERNLWRSEAALTGWYVAGAWSSWGLTGRFRLDYSTSNVLVGPLIADVQGVRLLGQDNSAGTWVYSVRCVMRDN
jgi:hypothetical protein